eukprot:UN08928
MCNIIKFFNYIIPTYSVFWSFWVSRANLGSVSFIIIVLILFCLVLSPVCRQFCPVSSDLQHFLIVEIAYSIPSIHFHQTLDFSHPHYLYHTAFI